MESKRIVEVINDLIEKNYDAHEGYLKASEAVESSSTKQYLKDCAEDRMNFAKSLQNEIQTYAEASGKEIDTDGSFKGSAHRTWMDVEAFFTGNDEERMLEECIRGDKNSLDEYEETLNENPELPSQLRSLIQEQMSRIRVTLDKVKSLENSVS